MRYALIGCGRISPNHIAAAQNNKLELVAVCDIDPSCMEDKVRKFKLRDSVNKYTDYREREGDAGTSGDLYGEREACADCAVLHRAWL